MGWFGTFNLYKCILRKIHVREISQQYVLIGVRFIEEMVVASSEGNQIGLLKAIPEIKAFHPSERFRCRMLELQLHLASVLVKGKGHPQNQNPRVALAVFVSKLRLTFSRYHHVFCQPVLCGKETSSSIHDEEAICFLQTIMFLVKFLGFGLLLLNVRLLGLSVLISGFQELVRVKAKGLHDPVRNLVWKGMERTRWVLILERSFESFRND